MEHHREMIVVYTLILFSSLVKYSTYVVLYSTNSKQADTQNELVQCVYTHTLASKHLMKRSKHDVISRLPLTHSPLMAPL